MKKTVLVMFLIVLIVLVAAMSVSALRYGATRYGAVYYYGSPYYMYYPVYYPGIQYAGYYQYPLGPLSSDWIYRYGVPNPVQEVPGQLCGLVDGQTFGCSYGFLCDYSKTSFNGIGVCIPALPQ